MIGKLWSSGVFPTSIDFSLRDPVNTAVEWVRDNVRTGVPIIGGTGSISDFIVIHLLEPIRGFLVNRPWWVIICGFTALAWATAGRRVAVICAVALSWSRACASKGPTGPASGTTR